MNSLLLAAATLVLNNLTGRSYPHIAQAVAHPARPPVPLPLSRHDFEAAIAGCGETLAIARLDPAIPSDSISIVSIGRRYKVPMSPQPFAISLRHLRALVAIADCGSMNAAAEVVSLSQPALTQGLAKLERQIGLALFERRPAGMTATPAGTVMAERGRAAFVHLSTGARGGHGFARPEHLITSAQARAFLALADAGSYVAAAAATGLSQPAVHRAANDLEKVVGARLIERRGRGVALNEAGRRLARGVRLAAREIAAALADLAENPVASGERIIVGAMPLCRAKLLPMAVARLVASEPGAGFAIVEGSWRELVAPLRDGSIDLLIGALRPDADVPYFAQTALFEDRLIVVGRAGHPLAGKVGPGVAEIAAYPWIVGPAGSPLRGQWESLFAHAGLPHAPIECGSVMTIRGLLCGGDYLTLLSPDQVGLELAAGRLAAIGAPLGGSARRIGIATRRDWRPTIAQRLFIAMLRTVAEECTIQDS